MGATRCAPQVSNRAAYGPSDKPTQPCALSRRLYPTWQCARHFVEMSKASPPTAVASVDEAALWLWRMHNSVNLRLNHTGDAATTLRYGLPKVQWPTREQCPTCRTASGRWREAPVLRYLRGSYCLAGSECGLAVDEKSQRNTSTKDMEEESAAGGMAALWNPSLQLAIGACLLAVAMSCLGGSCISLGQRKLGSARRAMRPVNHVPRVGLLSDSENDD